MFDHRHYVPCLRWKQGEYKAVSLLSSAASNLITPLIEVPEKGYDFETKSDKKTIAAHLALFPKRVATHWKKRPCFVDLNLIAASERLQPAIHPVTHVFDELEAFGCAAIPVTAPGRDVAYQRAVHQTPARKKRGLALRLTIEEAARPNLRTVLQTLLGDENKPENCDLILDLRAPNYTPLAGFTKLLTAIITRLPDLDRWRTFTVIGTSFPPHMGEIQTNLEIIPRHEWALYKLVTGALVKAGVRVPAFGDYAINHPDLLQKDMRLLKPSATIRYTINDAWLIVKGRNVRDYGYDQYRSLAKIVRTHTSFLGTGFSQGGKYVADCANGTEGTGNLSTWRWVGTNHHLEKVARDLASLSFA
jgi:hypothetical protein